MKIILLEVKANASSVLINELHKATFTGVSNQNWCLKFIKNAPKWRCVSLHTCMSYACMY